MSKHPHAELMAQYAQDALETDKPWERWQYKSLTTGKWEDCYRFLSWSLDHDYRRKPPIEPACRYDHFYTHIAGKKRETVDSILEATHISVYEFSGNGGIKVIHEVELPKTLLDIFDTHQTAVELYSQL